MGGFGALHTALTFPDSFGKVAALSSALIIHSIASMKPGDDNGIANYDYYRECFGEPENVIQSDNNPETLIKSWLTAELPYLIFIWSAVPKTFFSKITGNFIISFCPAGLTTLILKARAVTI